MIDLVISTLRFIKALWLPVIFTYASILIGMEVTLWGYAAAVFFVMDIVGRYSDYISLRSLTSTQRRRYFGLYSRTACGRQVMIAAHGEEARVFFQDRGYRPYHILPDQTFSWESPFIRPSFWIGLWRGHLK